MRNGSLNPDQKISSSYLMYFSVTTEHSVKIKGIGKNIRKYRKLLRNLKKIWNLKVSAIPIVDETLGTIPKNQWKKNEIIQIKNTSETDENT